MSATPEREQAEAIIDGIRERGQIVNNLGQPRGWWCLARESELDALAAAVSRLVEREAAMDANALRMIERAQIATRERAAAEAQLAAAVERAEKAEQALDAAVTQAFDDHLAAVERERELTRAAELLLNSLNSSTVTHYAWAQVGALAQELREALAGGVSAAGRPPEQDSGGIGLSADAVAEAGATHELKCWPGYFADVLNGSKPFEVRRDDRTPMFLPGDRLRLREWHPRNGYTGREVTRAVTYVLAGDQFGIEAGYCVMGLVAAVVPTTDTAEQSNQEVVPAAPEVLPEETP